MHGPFAQHGLGLSVGLVGVLALAAGSDVRSNRIPNWVSVTGIALGLGLRSLEGFVPFSTGALGAGLAFLISLPAFATGVLGGGDAKLLMAVGAFLGPEDFGYAALCIALAGGLLALVESGRRGVLGRTLAFCGSTLLQWATLGRIGPVQGRPLAQRLTVPYALAIAAGTLAWWFLGGVL